jgi:high affinity Mn2+ porin
MGNYHEAVLWGISHHAPPSLDSVRSPGHTKYGFGINIEQSLSKYTGAFMRVGWNDGHNETWAFTEIDRHLSAGLVFDGALWKRNNDKFGIAQIVNGISKEHRDYLKSGGYGLIIGDGNLNYGLEYITEIYYSFYLKAFNLSLSPDCQFIQHPAYNKDRGPVHAFGLRAHFEI